MRQTTHVTPRSTTASGINVGLRAHLQKVYAYMAGGIGFTGLVSYMVAATPALFNSLMAPPLGYVFLFAPLGVALFLSFGIQKLRSQTAQLLFWLYAGLMGISLSAVFLMYTGQSISRIFLVTSLTFGSMSLYGYTTKRDLSAFGSFLFMGLIGVVLASLVNLFMKSSALQFALSVISVLVFTGLTAYDTQAIRNMYDERLPEETLRKMALFGALQLYLDFVNIFLSLLRLFGDRR